MHLVGIMPIRNGSVPRDLTDRARCLTLDALNGSQEHDFIRRGGVHVRPPINEGCRIHLRWQELGPATSLPATHSSATGIISGEDAQGISE
jgi:hypothetical protein